MPRAAGMDRACRKVGTEGRTIGGYDERCAADVAEGRALSRMTERGSPASWPAPTRTQRHYVRADREGKIPVAFTAGTGRKGAAPTCSWLYDERHTAELDDLAGMD
ncbi:hypothetical protein Q8W71_30385 [Methylobacterium sp. NEAU 140]|uniref:hypothetical protein n=1 Tax=Methylobacterium sp. NEAU 140 TaxID=3064945 RepID=UPI0027377BE2|nr:hypothetical protein [Methylobacterium sp. NEAU 140]MDP4026903.1 hypothetical protein [Methylobacterium sp. NEAU 140]